MSVKALRSLLVIPLTALLTSCNLVLLHPSGDVARQQSNLLIASTVLIALIVVPVLIAIGVIAYRYRASNQKTTTYAPEWEHSTQLELLIWAAPLLIIVALGAMTWIATHTLDPYRPIGRIDAAQALPSDAHTLRVDVVSLEWKWLFFYPDYGIATVNQLAAPVDVPIKFNLTAATMMDSFFIPALAGQIYTMPGMQTQLHAIINKLGSYKGFSANYSGRGFTDMRFRFLGMKDADFKRWVQSIKSSGGDLDRKAYLKLAEPSRNEAVHHYASYASGLYSQILNRCVDPKQMCINKMMAIDTSGGRPPHEDGADDQTQSQTNAGTQPGSSATN